MNYCTVMPFLALTNRFPYAYLASILLFLASFSSFITIQLLRLFKSEIIFYRSRSRDLTACSLDDIFSLLKIMTRKRLWLESIQLLESKRRVFQSSMCQYFNALGFMYYSMQQYDLAKLYYLEALRIRSGYIVALQNLAKVYECLKDDESALSIYTSILGHDPDNRAATKYLQKKECLI